MVGGQYMVRREALQAFVKEGLFPSRFILHLKGGKQG
jgi:hypothetical protein